MKTASILVVALCTNLTMATFTFAQGKGLRTAAPVSPSNMEMPGDSLIFMRQNLKSGDYVLITDKKNVTKVAYIANYENQTVDYYVFDLNAALPKDLSNEKLQKRSLLEFAGEQTKMKLEKKDAFIRQDNKPAGIVGQIYRLKGAKGAEACVMYQLAAAFPTPRGQQYLLRGEGGIYKTMPVLDAYEKFEKFPDACAARAVTCAGVKMPPEKIMVDGKLSNESLCPDRNPNKTPTPLQVPPKTPAGRD